MILEEIIVRGGAPVARRKNNPSQPTLLANEIFLRGTKYLTLGEPYNPYLST